MKSNTVTIALAIVITILLTGFGVRTYYKSAERALIASYNTEININNSTIAGLQKQNAEYVKQIDRDSVMITEKNAEIARLKGQYLVIKSELVAAKDRIKNFTAGEAIEFFVNYVPAPDSKMLIQDADTALIVSSPDIRKVDDIFVEHASQKIAVVNLERTNAAMTNLIGTYIGSINSYKSLVNNKNVEIGILKDNAKLNAQKAELKSEKFRVQRNRARWTIAGVTVIAVTPAVIRALVK
jgi:hypothetical protein